jgi:hypothetical protein
VQGRYGAWRTAGLVESRKRFCCCGGHGRRGCVREQFWRKQLGDWFVRRTRVSIRARNSRRHSRGSWMWRAARTEWCKLRCSKAGQMPGRSMSANDRLSCRSPPAFCQPGRSRLSANEASPLKLLRRACCRQHVQLLQWLNQRTNALRKRSRTRRVTSHLSRSSKSTRRRWIQRSHRCLRAVCVFHCA